MNGKPSPAAFRKAADLLLEALIRLAERDAREAQEVEQSTDDRIRRVVREELAAIADESRVVASVVLTTQEAADLVRRHPGSVRRALEANELHGAQSVKRGRWRIRRECAEAWAAGEDCVHRQNVTAIVRQ